MFENYRLCPLWCRPGPGQMRIQVAACLNFPFGAERVTMAVVETKRLS